MKRQPLKVITTLQFGRQLARTLFARRGNEREMRFTETQLAAMFALVAQQVLRHPQKVALRRDG